MKSKALKNLESAQILINNKQFTSSVHCSYYAVFQYMKYMLAHTDQNPISFETQNPSDGKSSHEFIIEEIKSRLNTSSRNIRSFTEGVRLLKKDRVEADYAIRVFTDIESLSCIERANGLITNLKTYFGNI